MSEKVLTGGVSVEDWLKSSEDTNVHATVYSSFPHSSTAEDTASRVLQQNSRVAEGVEKVVNEYGDVLHRLSRE